MDNDFKSPAPQPGRTPNIPKEDPETINIDMASASEKPKKQRRFHIWPRKWSTKKKRIATAILVVVLVLIAAGAGYWWYRSHQKLAETHAAVEEKPAPTTEASKLTGVQVPIGTNNRGVIGVMIENSPDARPQSGLKEGGVIYEAVAEGGITRFMSLYQEAAPETVGPVRSARPYYIEWLAPYLASYAHVGGSPEALALIKQLGVRDLDQFHNPSAYWRVNTRYAPHNMYTSIPQLYQLAEQKGYIDSNFTGFVRKEAAPAEAPTVNGIDLNISSALYNVHYDYDPATHTYKRSMAGKPHVDEQTGAQLSPNVVVAVVMPSSIAADGIHTVYATSGSGPVFVFQDGVMTQGTWHKASANAQFTFTDAAGQPLALNPGQTWLTMVKDPGSVIYR